MDVRCRSSLSLTQLLMVSMQTVCHAEEEKEMPKSQHIAYRET